MSLYSDGGYNERLKRNLTAQEANFLNRNQGDEDRMASALSSQRTGDGQPGYQQPPQQQGPGQGGMGGGYNQFKPDIASYQKHAYNWAQAPTGYKSATITQFNVPNHAGIRTGTQSLVQNVLNNPHSMNEGAVQGMREQQKELAGQLQRDQLSGAQQDAARRGFGGVAQPLQNRIQDQFTSQLMGSYRDIDLAKVAQDRQDELAAMQAGDAFMNNDLQRSTQGYQTTLSGQMAQEQLRQQQAASEMDVASMMDRRQQMEAAEQQIAYQNELSRQGMLGNFGMNVAQLQEGQRQFGLNFGENQRQFNQNFGEGQRQWNGGMNFNYQNMANNNQNQLIQYLMSLGIMN
jgi:hypothetical protein